ncbi:MAG: ATPase [Lachnospiraceae bacterium]|nr:ATPase [Lachnospiraceae bacterium]
MSIGYNDVKERKEEIERELTKIYGFEKKYPKGELLCARNDSRYKWYLKEQGKTSYLPKNKRELAEMLATKKYFHYRKEELECELSACNSYLNKMTSRKDKSEQLLQHPEYSKLIAKYFIPIKESLMEWQNTDYERCDKHEEAFIIKGTQGKMLRSKSEAIIDRLLYQNRIPFHYEEKLVLNGIILYPDFVIRHPITGEYYYWEHFGMMDDAEYINHACRKIKLYCENGILPSINLITTFETKEHPLSIEKVEEIIQEYFGLL